MCEEDKCEKGEPHDWIFSFNSKGNTGDLGFGIKGFWDVDYYRCKKCGAEKRVEK